MFLFAISVILSFKKTLTTEEAWQRIYDEDILSRPYTNNIKQYFNKENYVSYVKKLQTGDGYFLHKSPMVYETSAFSEILNCIGEQPSKNTIDYIKSLQVGTFGFSETSGESPWTSKANFGVPMFAWFNISIEKKDDVAKFFKNFQNADGGFGSITNYFSTAGDTVETINILSYLNEEPKDVEGAVKKVKSYYQSGMITIFDYIETLKKLKYNFSNEEKLDLTKKINSSCKFDIKSESLEKISSCLEVLQLLNENIEKYRFVTENLTVGNDVYFNSALCKIYRLYNMTNNVHDELLLFVKNKELPQGGFNLREVYVLENSFTQQSMFLLGKLNEINNDKFIEWLLGAENKYVWELAPNSGHMVYYFAQIGGSLVVSNRTIPNEYGILNRAENEFSNALVDRSNYNSLRDLKEIFDRWMLLNADPKNIENPVKKVFSFWNEDGGFGDRNLSYMYATEWGVRVIYLADKFSTYKNIQHESWLEKIRYKTANWVKSAQNTDGGFGVAPNQPSNMQATYFAVRSLYLLNQRPKDIEKAIKWVASHQKEDGGFAGSLSTSSDLLFTYYSISSIIMLDDMKTWN